MQFAPARGTRTPRGGGTTPSHTLGPPGCETMVQSATQASGPVFVALATPPSESAICVTKDEGNGKTIDPREGGRKPNEAPILSYKPRHARPCFLRGQPPPPQNINIGPGQLAP